MKRVSRLGGVILLVMFLSGCFIQSFQPFYTDEVVVALPEVEGEWYLLERGSDEVAGEYPEPWRFGEGRVTTYQEGVDSDLEVTYFRVGDDYFADFSPSEAGRNGWWRLHNIAVHSVCRVELAAEEMLLTPLDGEWLVKMLQEEKISLPHFTLDEEDEHLVLSASSPQLLAFLQRYGKVPQAFPQERVYRFRRRGEAP